VSLYSEVIKLLYDVPWRDTSVGTSIIPYHHVSSSSTKSFCLGPSS